MFKKQYIDRSHLINRTVILFSSLLIFSWTVHTTLAISGGWTEDFTSNPTTRGWSYSGINPPLMSWDSTAGSLQCVWDSVTSLSQYGRGIDFGFSLDQDHSFNLQFDVTFNYFSVGAYSNYPLAIGLYNSTTFGNRQRNIVEWDYYLGTDSTYGGPNWTGFSVIDINGGYYNCIPAYHDLSGYTLKTSALYHINQTYDGGSKTMSLTMTENGIPFGSFPAFSYCGMEFTVDRFAVTNYYDDTPISWGGQATFRAIGTVDNIQLTYPLSVGPETWMKME